MKKNETIIIILCKNEESRWYSSLVLSFQQSQKSRLPPLCNLRLNNLLGEAGLLLKNCLDGFGRGGEVVVVKVEEEGFEGFLEAEVEVTSRHLSWHSCTDLNLLRLLAQWPL